LGCIISRWANKMNRKREKEWIQSDQPAWNPGGASATPQIRKIPVFDCAVALCTMQNAVSVISYSTWLDKMHHWWLVTWLDLSFKVSLCEDPRLRAITPTFLRCRGLEFSNIRITATASSVLVGDSLLRKAIGPRSRGTCSSYPIISAQRLLCGNDAPLFFTAFISLLSC
jgi:hypothetical protein